MYGDGVKNNMWIQVKFQVTNPEFMDKDSDNIYGGIAKYVDGDDFEMIPELIICGCCGSEFEPQDVKILERYNDWMDLTETIISE